MEMYHHNNKPKKRKMLISMKTQNNQLNQKSMEVMKVNSTHSNKF